MELHDIVDFKEIGTLNFTIAPNIISWEKYLEITRAVSRAYPGKPRQPFQVIIMTETGMVYDYRKGCEFSQQGFCHHSELYKLNNLEKYQQPTINSILQATGLTQAAMAAELGIPRRSIENWASGQRTPPDYLIRLIAEHYGLK